MVAGTSHEPLAAHARFRTSETEEAQFQAARVLSTHRLDVVDRRLDARLNAASLGPVTLCYLEYGAAVEVSATGLGDYVAVNIPTRGAMRVEHGGEDFAATPRRAAVFSPDGPLRQRWSADLSKFIVRVDRTALADHLGALAPAHRPAALRLEPRMDLDGPGAAVAASVTLLRDLLERHDGPGAIPAPVADRAVEMLLTALLLAQPGDHSDDLRRAPPPASGRVVRRAVEFIEAHADTIGTVREIADAAGVSIRTLQVAFRAERAESPAACLRDVRLARAHAALLAADPGSGDSVTEIALRHGFAHAGRFAAAYRRRYGQAPGATLRA